MRPPAHDLRLRLRLCLRLCAAGSAAVLLLLAGCSDGHRVGAPEGASTPDPRGASRPTRPLAGSTVVLDPGHQLGNRRFVAETRRPVDAGGFDKACNTTGTATDGGYPEATFAWEVARELGRELRRLGARVVLTRTSNSLRAWGPCIDDRGRAGNPDQPGPTADAKVSLHADGVYDAAARGFHVIRPGVLPGLTDDVAVESSALAARLRDALVAGGFPPSTYVGREGIDARTDLATLNLSDVPVVMAELGNMRHPGDAAVMDSERGRLRYARALADGIRAYLTG